MELKIQVVKRLRDFSLETDLAVSGERIGIFGPSGSGKTTLVSILAGLQQPDRGEIGIDGITLYSGSGKINLPAEKRRIALVFQQHCLFPHLSVKANLMYGYRRCKPELRTIDYHHLAEVLQLEGLLSRGVANLSGGEKQRVALGRAVLYNPRLLVMDEPLSALDDGLRFRIIPYLKSVSEEFRIPFLFISHSIVEMRLLTEQVLVLAEGKVVEETSTERLARSRMGHSPVGYINLIRGTQPRLINGVFCYRWGGRELYISAGKDHGDALFELSSKDIMLFKRHPEAVSARNLLKCQVVSTFLSGSRVGVELATGQGRLVAEVVHDAAEELGIRPGSELHAAIKATAFRRM